MAGNARSIAARPRGGSAARPPRGAQRKQRAPKGQPLKAQGGPGGQKRRKDDDFFLMEDDGVGDGEGEDGGGWLEAAGWDERGAGARGEGQEEEEQEEEEEEEAETAAEKRLRVAKAYLDQVKAATKAKRQREARDEFTPVSGTKRVRGHGEEGDGGVGGEAEGEDEEEEEEDEEEEEEEDEVRDSLVAEHLRKEQMEESGRLTRHMAHRFVGASDSGAPVGRRHRQPVTAVALSSDDARAFCASKDGLIVDWDVEYHARLHPPGHAAGGPAGTGEPAAGVPPFEGLNGAAGDRSGGRFEWPKDEARPGGAQAGAAGASGVGEGGGGGGGRRRKKNKGGGKGGGGGGTSRHVLALAVSSDGRYLAGGGYDRKVHLWDVRTRQHIQSFSGHRGAVTALAFRQGALQLFSAAQDRSIKVWSMADLAYMDSLFGHQSDVVGLDCLRQERLLSVGRDRTARIWKVPEESQLVFRSSVAAVESCALLSSSAFLTGCDDGSVALWSAQKKKPAHIYRGAHGAGPSHAPSAAPSGAGHAVPNGVTGHSATAAPQGGARPLGAANHSGSAQGAAGGGAGAAAAGPAQADGAGASGGMAAGWVGAVAACRGSDLAASGAGDGVVKLWHCDLSRFKLSPLASLPTPGFVNSLAFATSGRFLLAGGGQEPRLGRWAHIPNARNGVMLHRLNFESED